VGWAAVASVLALSALSCGSDGAIRKPVDRGVILVAVDGLDPRLLRTCIRDGRAPNLARMAQQGAFVELQTSNPPQSPVAWSHFITGTDWSSHGIYDFVHRDPDKLSAYLSTSRTHDASWVLEVGSHALPLRGGSVELLRGGRPFWEVLADHGLPVTVMKIPAHFPPSGSGRSEVLAGMGVPDLLGTYGTFSVFTNDPNLVAKGQPSGGQLSEITYRGQRATGALQGPPNPLSASGDALTLPVEIIADRRRPVALIRVGRAELVLQPGEWSQWVPVEFDPGPLGGAIHGMVRLYLRSLLPHTMLYVSPINIDPLKPAVPLSEPSGYARELALDIGRYYTQGMPEDTKALEAGVLSEAEFLDQAEYVFEERRRMIDRELDRYQGGLLFLYFSSIDQLSHIFWSALDPDAEPELQVYADVLPSYVERIDRVLGQVLARAPEGTLVLVMSDHGFERFRHRVHLNTWLADRGFLALHPPGAQTDGMLGHIDWSLTQAYALGLNQIFVNLEGRERHGVVPASERDAVLSRLSRELLRFRDPDTGEQVVSRVELPPRGAYPDRAPDLIVGYNRGYRSSEESALGRVGQELIEPNHAKWAGDHCMDPAHVPALLVSPRALSKPDPSLLDLGPTIISYFGIAPPEGLEGVSILAPD